MAIRAGERPPADVASRVDHAKEPVTVIAGPYGHPFHPILVTVPIGAWIASLVFDIASNVKSGGSPALVDGAYWLIGIGIVGAAVAAVFGLLDLLAIPSGSRARTMGLVHLVLNVVVLALFVVNFIWRSDDHDQLLQTRAGQMVLSIVAIVLLAASGWIGGMLTYRFGVRVAREEVQAEGYR
jgi:uncharacterized membrane protein